MRLVLKEKQSDIDFAVRRRRPVYAQFNSATCIAVDHSGARTQYLDMSRGEWWRGVFGQVYDGVDGLELVKDERLRTLVISRVRHGGRP